MNTSGPESGRRQEGPPEDETLEDARRIAQDRLERDRRLKEIERQARLCSSHELHTSIGD